MHLPCTCQRVFCPSPWSWWAGSWRTPPWARCWRAAAAWTRTRNSSPITLFSRISTHWKVQILLELCLQRVRGDEWGLRILLINDEIGVVNFENKKTSNWSSEIECVNLGICEKNSVENYSSWIFRQNFGVVVSKMWCMSRKQIAKIKQGISSNYKLAVIVMS